VAAKGELSGELTTTLIGHHHHPRLRIQTMAPISTNRYNTSTRGTPPAPPTQPTEHTLQQQTGSPSRRGSIVPNPSGIPSDSQTFPILPEQLEKHLEQVQQRLTNNAPTRATPASVPTPSPSPGKILVLNPPLATMPTVSAFHAPSPGMPSMSEYLQLLMRYLDELAPSKRGKALIDSELMRRIELVLALHHKGFSGSGEAGSDYESAPPVPYGAGGSWDTLPFRRWVRSTFVYRPATRTELERAIDFGLLSPPESSLSGPGVPGHAPSANLTCSRYLVFHEDRPVALRSRIYKIILRAHWIANHAGRDRTWAIVREMCSYIPKCLVYDFVAACPTCRVVRPKQYGIYAGPTRAISTAAVVKLHYRSQNQGAKGDPKVETGPPPIPPVSSYDAPPEGRLGPNDLPHPNPIPNLTYPPWDPPRHHETNAQIVAVAASDLPFGHLKLPPISIPHQAARLQQPLSRDHDTQQETPVLERRYPSWAGISKLIERVARNGEDEDPDALTDSPTPRREDGPSVPEEGGYAI